MNVNISFFLPTHISAGVQNALNVYSISPGTSILLFLFLNIQHAVLSCSAILFFCQVFFKHNIYILSFYLITTVLGSKHRKNKHRETCKLTVFGTQTQTSIRAKYKSNRWIALQHCNYKAKEQLETDCKKDLTTKGKQKDSLI